MPSTPYLASFSDKIPWNTRAAPVSIDKDGAS